MKPKQMRELDAWIAEHVIGLKKISLADVDSGKERVGPGVFVSDWIHTTASCPHYTTDPAPAMMVLEKCAEKCNWTMIFKNGCEWHLSPNSVKYKTVHAQTLPLAICLFAKKLFEKGSK